MPSIIPYFLSTFKVLYYKNGMRPHYHNTILLEKSVLTSCHNATLPDTEIRQISSQTYFATKKPFRPKLNPQATENSHYRFTDFYKVEKSRKGDIGEFLKKSKKQLKKRF